jgi:hypothetical protein
LSKRTRGSVRPGQRRSTTRPPATRVTGAQSALPASPLETAGDLGETSLVESAAPQRGDARRATRVTTTRTAPPTRASTLLAGKASQEYVYVAQDVRRIIIVGGILFAVMFVLWLLIMVLRVIPI